MDEMDNFTQRMVENAQKRSKTLGISNVSKVPLTECNTKLTPSTKQQNSYSTISKNGSVSSPKRHTLADSKMQIIPTSSNNKTVARTTTATAVTSERSVCIEAKENVDLALEINITTGPNVQVQVEVEEQEIDGDGNVLSTNQSKRKHLTATENGERFIPKACIRDLTRKAIGGLGALYSNPQDLSSPVHRTEPNFTIEQEQEKKLGAKPKTRFAKLTQLANSINEWEDESKYSSQKDNVDRMVDRAPMTATQAKASEPKIVGVCPRKIDSPSKKRADEKETKSILNRSNAIESKEMDSNRNASKHLKWDKTIMDSLESQGFKRRDTTTSRLEYDFKAKTDKYNESAKSKTIAAQSSSKNATTVAMPSAKKVDITKGLVSGRTAIFENNPNRSHAAASKHQKDPAEMSLKERLALFEKNKGTALIPKAALGMAPSVKQIMADQNHMAPSKQVVTTPQQPMVSSSAVSTTSTSKINNFNKAVKADSTASGTGIQQTVAALLSNPATISESRIAAESRKAREQEMDVLLNRFNHRSVADDVQSSAPSMSPPPAPPMPTNLLTHSNNTNKKYKRMSDEKLEISPQVRSSLEDIKRVKINPPKNGHMYPALSDIESTESEKYATETYTDDDNEQQMMDRYMYSSQDEDEDDSYMDSEEAESNRSNNYDNRSGSGKRVQYLDSTTASSASDYNEMDDYLEEALEDDDVDDEGNDRNCDKNVKQTKNGSISSNSFCFEKKPLTQRHQTIQETMHHEDKSNFNSPITSKLTVNPSEDNSSVTLTHTVSFYRRQQTQSANSTPVRKVIHSNFDEEQSSSNNGADYDDGKNESSDKYLRSQAGLVTAKIKSLLDNVTIQQQQISQASNALNTCASTVEFSGSTESVVAEWKLLVATHSRQAALNEVTRLRVEGYLRPADAPKECGRLTVKEITVPLKQDYISKLSTDKISGHHLVCLLKYNEQVLATKTIPTLPGLLSVKFPDSLQLENVYADFKITLEIYGMTAQREFLPHDIKYHIKNKKGVIKTPKGKKPESRLIMPPIQSPAGPNAVRAPSFVQYGFVIFSLREINRSNWTLNQVSGVSPLIGTVHMKVNCALSVNIDHKAFLTMFEDISGFGAWHRRWCHLHGNVLSYWKYPDDERKPPIGSLDLSTCEQQKIGSAPRDVCARLNTLLIELKRPRRDEDCDSLILKTNGAYTIVSHLLSADTKEERNEWCAHFNKALALMRAWGTQR